MTDLERVRETLDREIRDDLVADIDAHLKEDAEREVEAYKKALHLVGQEYKAEAARLREDPPLRRALADEKAYAAELREQRDTLLAVVKQLCHAEDDGKGYRTWWDNARAAIAEVEGKP